MKIKLHFLWWEYVRCELRKSMECDGYCDNPWDRNKRVMVHETLKNAEEMETTIHECIHAASYQVDERIVASAALSITKKLWGSGYRLRECCKTVQVDEFMEQVIREELYEKMSQIDSGVINIISFDVHRVLLRLGYRRTD